MTITELTAPNRGVSGWFRACAELNRLPELMLMVVRLFLPP